MYFSNRQKLHIYTNSETRHTVVSCISKHTHDIYIRAFWRRQYGIQRLVYQHFSMFLYKEINVREAGFTLFEKTIFFSPGLDFIITDLPSVLILITADQI